MVAHSYGTRINPAAFIEQSDPANPGQVKRPDSGLTVYVRNAKTGTDLPAVTTDPYGYIPTFTVDDVPSVFFSTTSDFANPIGPIASREAIDAAINGAINAGGQSAGNFVLASANGVDHSGSGDGRPALQTLMNSCLTLGLPIMLGPGTIRLASMTDGTNKYALVNRGVSMYATPGETTIRLDGVQANIMWIGATLSTTAVATITADVTVGTKTYQVDSSAGFTVGAYVFLRARQNRSDIQEARQAVVARVTAVPDATHITLDVAAEWEITGLTTQTTTEQEKNHQITLITSLPSDVRVEGIRFQGDALTRHGIGVQVARNVTIDQCVGFDVGSGLWNTQWCDGFSVTNCRVDRCLAYGDANKGRAGSFSNTRGSLVSNLVADGCEGPQIYVESYSTVRMENLTIHNRSATRSQPYNIFCGEDCLVEVDGYTHTGSVADSIVSYGTGPGVCTISNATIYAPLSSVRQFPITAATGMFRVLDSTGILRTFNTLKVEKSQVKLDLTAGATQTQWLRDGLHIGYEVLVTAGVTTSMLTSLTIGRTSVGSLPLSWEAGKVKRSTTWVGGGLYPMASAYAQGTKVTAVTSSVALPAGAFVAVTLYSVNYDGADTTISEPGSAQTARFLSLSSGSGSSSGGSSGPVTVDNLPANLAAVAVKTSAGWPASRPITRTDWSVLCIGPGDPPSWMSDNDVQLWTPV